VDWEATLGPAALGPVDCGATLGADSGVPGGGAAFA
jgi:hypothetical protein